MRFLLETLLVFVAAAAPIVLLNGGIGILISAGILYFFLKRRDKSAGPGPIAREPDPAFAKFRFYRGFASIMAFIGLSLMPIAAWIFWAFPEITELYESAWLSYSGAIGAMAGMLAASLLLGWLAVASLRWPGETMGDAYRRVLAGREWDALRPVVMNFAMYLAMMGIVGLYSSLSGLIRLFGTITQNGRLTDALEAAIALPAVPGWLYAAIVLLALFRRLNAEDALADLYGDEWPAMGQTRPALACAAVAGCGAVMLLAMGNLMHHAVFGVFGPVGQVRPITAIVTGIEDWVAREQESGRSGREIVAALRTHGRWSPANPESGLVVLIPALKTGKSYGAMSESPCDFSLEAGLANIDDLGDFDWLPEDEATQTVAYCLSIDCPSPTRWPDDATRSLYSSHSSQNRYWVADRFLDVFGWGAEEPGGFCTTTGAMADRFQG